MRATFLVEVELEDVSPQVLMDEAATIQQDLFSSGLDVISVKPWTRPTLAPLTDNQMIERETI